MSNNLLPQPCMPMGKCINVVTTSDLISNPEMRLSKPTCSQISGRQDFHVMVPSAASLGSVNMNTTQLLGKRKSPLHPSLQNKRMVLPMEPMPVQSSSVSPRTQFLPASFVSKNTFVSCNKPGKQAAVRKQTLQKLLPLKPQNELSGSVRSKMRESLAGALAMVQCQMESPKESKMLHSETGTNPLNSNVCEPVSDASRVDLIVSDESTTMLTLTDPSPLGGMSMQTGLPEISTIMDKSDPKEIIAQEPQAVKPFVQDNVSYSDNVFSKDDLLQGSDLSWALKSDIEFTENCEKEMNGAIANDGSQKKSKQKLLLDPLVLACKIEAELFKLFSGVNKKYKEKGRSLLFNLKDKSNPKLREKVMYGEIAADRLCYMSAEELASEELAEWRQAKAEEMAQMVVLQDTEVDIRSLVRKTHKGEFQVEVEPMDSGSVEVSVGSSSLNWSRPKHIKKKTPSITGTLGIKKESNSSDKGTSPINGDTIDEEMQAVLMNSCHPVVSLDEFMSSKYSESPSDYLSSDSEKKPSVSDNNDSEAVLVCTSPREIANFDLGTSSVKAETSSPVKADTSSPVKAEDSDMVSSKPGSDLKSESSPVFIPDGESVWEGALQLSTSSVSSVIGILRSGEKTTTKEWPMLLEIKGRVRLDAFEKFVRELPNSRSRAVMVISFVCREECSKTEQEIISEVVDSYAKDERVGFAEPASGVELYLCPTGGRTGEILNKIVPRNQLDFLKSLEDDGLIGVVVWRRPQFKKPLLSNNSLKNNHQKGSSLTTLNTSHCVNMLQVNNKDDVPPGFGPMTMARDDEDEDDLPEFNYFSGDHVMKQTSRSESVRELIQKYGKSEPLWNQRFNDDDNDILPEWKPQPNPSFGLSHVNGGSMIRPRSEWWSNQAGEGRY